ncbi:hypothetical protein PIB30_032938 [Stylosanthes scabra]|uniref:Uncharacterized protein n=1 Tax=Stylosanthes scabra TaxID=79078 RepID=A0ABU6XA59_9FABA|nr:hypothetical protein [Stylosanthes scabra]
MINSGLVLPHVWTKVFPMIPLDVSQEEYVASDSSHAITSKHINQMRRDLVDQGAADAQPNAMEILLKGFEGIQAKMDEGFARLSDRIDSLDILLISQGEEIKVLWDEFRTFRGEDPMAVEPEADVPMAGDLVMVIL